jgi:hypothetical protein
MKGNYLALLSKGLLGELVGWLLVGQINVLLEIMNWT